MGILPEAWAMWALIIGILLVLVASVIEAYWEFGRQARPEFRPSIFQTRWRNLLVVGWILMLLVGGALLLLVDWWITVAGIAVFYLLLPFTVGPRVRKYVLPPWDELKGELEKQGYNEHNYWRRGDWWKEEARNRGKRGY